MKSDSSGRTYVKLDSKKCEILKKKFQSFK